MTGRRTLRVGVVGAGSVATAAHLPAWQHSPDVDIAWIVDVSAGKAAARAAQFGVPAWSTDLTVMLSHDDVDAVDVCTPAHTHPDQVIAAVTAGKHVLVEKPMATGLADARCMRAAADAAGVVAMVAENWVYSSAYRRAEELVRAGVIGDELFLVEAVHETDFATRAERPPGSDPVQLGYFAVTGPHVVSTVRHLIGEFAAVAAFATSIPGSPGDPVRVRDRDLTVSAQLALGTIGTFHFTGRMGHDGPPVRTIRVVGTGGWIRFDPFTGQVELAASGSVERVDGMDRSPGFRETINHFIACCRNGEKPRTSLADQVETVRTTDAIYQAATTGRTVTLAAGRIR